MNLLGLLLAYKRPMNHYLSFQNGLNDTGARHEPTLNDVDGHVDEHGYILSDDASENGNAWSVVVTVIVYVFEIGNDERSKMTMMNQSMNFRSMIQWTMIHLMSIHTYELNGVIANDDDALEMLLLFSLAPNQIEPIDCACVLCL